MLGATGGCKNLSAARGQKVCPAAENESASLRARSQKRARAHTLTGTTEREEGVTSELSEDDHLRVL